MQDLENKYIDLLLEKCTNFTNTKSILINYHEENKSFIEKLVQKLKAKGINDIYLDEESPRKYHELLTKSKEEIKSSGYFDKSIWNKYAKKKACFLMLKSEYPGQMDDLDIDKVNYASKLTLDSRKIYFDKQKKNEIPWCIAVLPSEVWAKKIFPKDKKPFEKLFKLIGTLCLLNEKNPVKAWELLRSKSKKQVDKLNKLQIKSLHYTNKMGTDFTVELTPDALWCGLAQDTLCIVNLPSYEIFTSPDLKSAKGIVYGALPLYYNNQKVDGFYLKFENGQVIDYDAKEGKEVLKGLMAEEDSMKFLGEIALVDKTSPIAQSKVLFGTTLLDENASCHLALGEGFPECLKNGNKLNDKKLKAKGINIAKNHVDMMIGTDDLNIEAETFTGKKVKIMVDGKLTF